MLSTHISTNMCSLQKRQQLHMPAAATSDITISHSSPFQALPNMSTKASARTGALPGMSTNTDLCTAGPVTPTPYKPWTQGRSCHTSYLPPSCACSAAAGHTMQRYGCCVSTKVGAKAVVNTREGAVPLIMLCWPLRTARQRLQQFGVLLPLLKLPPVLLIWLLPCSTSS